MSRQGRSPPSADASRPELATDPQAVADADPSDCLLRALASDRLAEKRLFCQLGLSARGVDDELRALLLRQLYLAELEEGNDAEALAIAEAMVELETLGDVARQDAARAAVALGQLDMAVAHLQVAARICPAGRRAFHYCHLGALLRFAGRKRLALEALGRAVRWAVTDRALYQALLALTEAEDDQKSYEWQELREQLEDADSQKGYALWVLGELALRAGDLHAAQGYLTRFLERLDDAPRAKSLSLQSEIAHARELLRRSLA